jgi:hypothetical protein
VATKAKRLCPLGKVVGQRAGWQPAHAATAAAVAPRGPLAASVAPAAPGRAALEEQFRECGLGEVEHEVRGTRQRASAAGRPAGAKAPGRNHEVADHRSAQVRRCGPARVHAVRHALHGADVAGGARGKADAALVLCRRRAADGGVGRRAAGFRHERVGRSAIVCQRPEGGAGVAQVRSAEGAGGPAVEVAPDGRDGCGGVLLAVGRGRGGRALGHDRVLDGQLTGEVGGDVAPVRAGTCHRVTRQGDIAQSRRPVTRVQPASIGARADVAGRCAALESSC